MMIGILGMQEAKKIMFEQKDPGGDVDWLVVVKVESYTFMIQSGTWDLYVKSPKLGKKTEEFLVRRVVYNKDWSGIEVNGRDELHKVEYYLLGRAMASLLEKIPNRLGKQAVIFFEKILKKVN